MTDWLLLRDLQRVIDECPMLEDVEAAEKLVQEYSAFLTGRRPKSPAGDGLTIQQNQYLRYWTYIHTWKRGLVTKEQPHWDAVMSGHVLRPDLVRRPDEAR